MADTQVLEACARKAWGFKSPLPTGSKETHEPDHHAIR